MPQSVSGKEQLTGLIPGDRGDGFVGVRQEMSDKSLDGGDVWRHAKLLFLDARHVHDGNDAWCVRRLRDTTATSATRSDSAEGKLIGQWTSTSLMLGNCAGRTHTAGETGSDSFTQCSQTLYKRLGLRLQRRSRKSVFTPLDHFLIILLIVINRNLSLTDKTC